MIVIIAAMEQEVSFLRYLLAQGKADIPLVTTGVGRDNSVNGVRGLLQEVRPRLLLHVGFGGALQPGLRSGDLVLCSRLRLWEEDIAKGGATSVESEKGLLETARNALKSVGLKFHEGDALTTSRLVRKGQTKRGLGTATTALVVDLESYWIGLEARSHGVPFLSVRSVLDTVSQGLPLFVEAFTERNGWSKPPMVVGAFIREPWNVKEAWRLRSQATSAQRSLGLFARAFLDYADLVSASVAP